MPVPLIGVGVVAAANFIVRKGVVKAAKKDTPALISKAKKYINKNKLILSGNKVIKPKKGQIKYTKKTTTKKTTTKKTPVKKTTPTGTTKPGAKSKVPGLIIGVGTLGGGALLMKGGGDKGTSGSGMTFNQAFAKARKEKGKNATFSYKGKMYSTATMEDVKKAGFDNLKDYLNAKKK